MRFTPALTTLLAATTFVAAQPAPSDPPPPPAEVEPPPPAPAPPPSAEADAPPAQAPAPAAVRVPPGQVPPIVINITNNNNGNNSNTNTAPVTVATPVTVSTPVSVAPGAVAPTAAVPARPPHGIIERFVLHPRTQRWIALGVTAGPHGENGARASVDVLTHGAFSLGIDGEVDGLALDEHGRGGGSSERGGERGQRGRRGNEAGSVGAYLAWTGKLGSFDLRAQLGVATGGSERDDRRGGRERRDGAGGGGFDGAVHGEAAVLVGLPLTHHLGLVAGPVVTSEGRAVDMTGFGGVRWRF